MKITKKTDRKIEVSNYILLLVIFVIIIVLTLVLRNLYVARENSDLNTPVLENILTSKINSNELDNYLKENLDSIVLVTVTNDKKSREVEKSIKNYISKNDLNNEITYLSITEDMKEEFIDMFNKNYKKDDKVLEDIPSVIHFEDGKIKDILQYSINKNSFKDFIDNVRDDK